MGPRHSAPLLLALSLGGCELTEVTTSPTEEVLVVEAALRAGDPVQRLLLHRSLPAAVSGDSDAEVTVTTEAGRVIAFQAAPADQCIGGLENPDQEEVAAGATYFTAESSTEPWVRPGESYELSVRTSDGRDVQGITRVPDPYRLLSPALEGAGDSCRLPPGQSLPLVWTASEGAWVYFTTLVAHGLDETLDGEGIEAPARLEFDGVVISATDTTKTLPGDFIFDELDLDRDLLLAIQDGFPEGTRLELVVAAAERNFVNAVRGGEFHPSGSVRISSVVGDGVGYFGALVPLRFGIVVTSNPIALPDCLPPG